MPVKDSLLKVSSLSNVTLRNVYVIDLTANLFPSFYSVIHNGLIRSVCKAYQNVGSVYFNTNLVTMVLFGDVWAKWFETGHLVRFVRPDSGVNFRRLWRSRSSVIVNGYNIYTCFRIIWYGKLIIVNNKAGVIVHFIMLNSDNNFANDLSS